MADKRETITAIYNSFDGKNLEALDAFYASNVAFQDPVTSTRGLAQLKKYYAHAYANVRSIQFDFDEIARDGNQYFAPWTMKLRVRGLNRGKAFSVKGISHLKFNAKGLVEYHRDYFDLGEMVYERLPIQGFVISQFKKLLS